MISRLISNPTTKKKIVINPSLIQNSMLLVKSQLPKPSLILVCQNSCITAAAPPLANTNAATVATSNTTPLIASICRNRRTGPVSLWMGAERSGSGLDLAAMQQHVVLGRRHDTL